jgi:hypothetical protein
MSSRLERPRASGERIRAIKQGERKTTPDRDDRSDRPAVEGPFRCARHVPGKRNVPGSRKYKSMTLVEIGIAFVNLGIERIK